MLPYDLALSPCWPLDLLKKAMSAVTMDPAEKDTKRDPPFRYVNVKKGINPTTAYIIRLKNCSLLRYRCICVFLIVISSNLLRE